MRGTIHMVSGKPYRACDCDEHTGACPLGRDRGGSVCLSLCLVPADFCAVTVLASGATVVTVHPPKGAVADGKGGWTLP